MRVNEILTEYQQPGLGLIRQPRPAARFEKTPVNTEQVAAALGEHGREILHEAGFTEAEISELLSRGVMTEPGAD